MDKPFESGRYMVGGKPAFVVGRRDGGVEVFFDDNSWTAARVDTFLKWGVTRINAPEDK